MMNFLFNPTSAYSIRPTQTSDGYIGTFLRSSPYGADGVLIHVPIMVAVLATADLANVPVAVKTNADTTFRQLSVRVNEEELLVVRRSVATDGGSAAGTVLARYRRRPLDGDSENDTHRYIDDLCRILTARTTVAIAPRPTSANGVDFTIGFIRNPSIDDPKDQIQLTLVSDAIDNVFETSNIHEIQFRDATGRTNSIAFDDLYGAITVIWQTPSCENAVPVDSGGDLPGPENSSYLKVSWSTPGNGKVSLHRESSNNLTTGIVSTLDNDAFAKLVLDGARRLSEVSALTASAGSASDLTPVLNAISSQTAHLDGETSSQTTTVMGALSSVSTSLHGAIATAETFVGGKIAESTATLIAAISAIDFDQSPTMGLANLIQSQNRVTQALVLALLRKSSSRAWFTSLIDKIGDANALLIDDNEIAAIAEKAYQGDTVSNDEIHATPREAYKELFNDRGVNNG